MNEKDVALFQHAEQLANAGQKLDAYSFFRGLQERNPEQVEVLFWIVATTSNAAEAQYAIDTIKRLQPDHPKLHELETFHYRKLQPPPVSIMPIGPVLHCPYCGQRAPARIKGKISVGGWVWFAAWFVVFLCFMWVQVPVADLPNMEKSALFCLGVGIIGLFVIRKRIYNCGHCGSRITDAS